jgi:serine/threonine protein kinase
MSGSAPNSGNWPSFGTPGYAAPEIFDLSYAGPDRQVSGRLSDVFSLGIVLLELLTLRNPITEDSDLIGDLYGSAGVHSTDDFMDYSTAAFFPSRSLFMLARRYRDLVASREFSARVRSLDGRYRALVEEMTRVEPAERPHDVGTVLRRLDGTAPRSVSIFLSHSSADKDRFVRPLAEELRARGMTVWLDEVDLILGQPVWETIGRAVELSEYLLVVLSEHSIASHAVAEELRYAADQNLSRVKILPIVLDDLQPRDLPPQIRSRHFLRAPAPTSGDSAREVAGKVVESINRLRQADGQG